jgi:hypothetical protein
MLKRLRKTWEFYGNTVLIPGLHLLLEKHFKMKVELNFRIDILAVHANFRVKLTFFMSYVKKIKKCLNENYFLASNFIFFTHDTKRAQKTLRRVRLKYIFFYILKYV